MLKLKEMEKLHDNFGHPRLTTFVKYLKLLGATEEDLKNAEEIAESCPYCLAHGRIPARPGVAMPQSTVT